MIDKRQFISGVLEKVNNQEELLEGRLTAEGNVCGCLLGDLTYYDDSGLEASDFLTKHGRMLFNLGKQLREKGLSNFDEISLLSNINEDVKEKIDKHQKEYVLREELKTIREELGEDNIQSEIDGFLEETKKLKAPKEVKDKLEKEINRLKILGMNSSESGVIRGYVETLLEMPWSKMQKETSDIKLAQQILDEDHYGLEQVKERVLEFLAVRALNKEGQSPILCLVGPPGTGKTSIAKSIARALNKKYVRICLGGAQDEAVETMAEKVSVGTVVDIPEYSLSSISLPSESVKLEEVMLSVGASKVISPLACLVKDMLF